MATKGIIYYTTNKLNPIVAEAVQEQLLDIGLPITSASLQPMPEFGNNFYVKRDPGYLTMFIQILTCLRNAKEDIIFFCEHDVLYHPSHFDFTPPDYEWYYNHNWWRIGNGDMAVHWDADQVSGITVNRLKALAHYENVVNNFDPNNFRRSFEPASGKGAKAWKSTLPNIDIRGNWNVTKHKWSMDDFRNKASAKNFEVSTVDKIPGWTNLERFIA